MEEIIAPISKEILKAELSEDKRLRFTNKSHNEIYVITYQDSPNVMKEIGRLREIAFRAAGGGTGKAMDIDEYDVMENPYKQLVVWNPEAEEILGGYRYLLGDEVQFDEHGKPVLATAHMFNFSEVFLKEYLHLQVCQISKSYRGILCLYFWHNYVLFYHCSKRKHPICLLCVKQIYRFQIKILDRVLIGFEENLLL